MLSKNEIAVLRYLQKKGKATISELEKSGINYDAAKRGAYFLSEKGLAKITPIISTVTAEKPLKNLVDQLLSFGNMPIKNLPTELRPAIGPLKKIGAIEISNGIIKIRKKALSEEEYKKIGAIVEKEEVTDYIVEITEKGMKEKLEEGFTYLTKDLMESHPTFRRPNVVMKDISPATAGNYHILTQLIRKIKQIFVELGFEEMDGYYVEESFWNFDALFQPQDHPSRELADTFYLPGEKITAPEDIVERVKTAHEKYWKYKWSFEEAKKLILRTHTTVLSSRTLAKKKKGKFFAIGRVFRNEAIDYKHLAEFHQVEGIVAWKEANLRQLLWVLREFYKRLGFEKIRFRPSYFPYTEPSLEIEVWFDDKKEWIELGGAGIFRKQVVEPLGAEYPVLAFGLSLERPLMLMLRLRDIRTFYFNDYEFLDTAYLG